MALQARAGRAARSCSSSTRSWSSTTSIQPTFVRDYPVDARPLARPHRSDPRLAEAWDLVIGGVEIAPAYSELVDPVEQRRRLVAQSLAAAAGDPEAMELDEDFLRALEYGMPPTGGMGLGVDRLDHVAHRAWHSRDDFVPIAQAALIGADLRSGAPCCAKLAVNCVYLLA